jgi:excisionase family DNA binding protein
MSAAVDQQPPPELLTVDELAEILRLNRKSAYAMVQRGEVPGVRRFGRAIRVHRATVLRWLADGQSSDPRPRRHP